MQIIGHTKYGYLVEMEPRELGHLTGNHKNAIHSSGYYAGRSESHPIGTKFDVTTTWEHLQAIQKTEERRKQIAESLRAAATLIEHTPQALLPLPAEPTTEG